MKKNDIIILLITFVYTILSFINLGSMKNPESFWNTSFKYETAIIELTEENVKKIKYYNGVESGSFNLYTSLYGDNYMFLCSISKGNCFAWYEIEIDRTFKYIKIEAQDVNSYIGEFAFYNEYGEKIKIFELTENAKSLIDEQKKVPEKINFMNNTYFDEIYHPNFAYRYVNGLEFYDVHPPLGKLIIAFAIFIFGMNPFSYRLMGNIAGIVMIPVMYIIAKDMFKDKKYGILAAIIMACDNFHFVQTRIATLDSFLVLFIMLSYMFMYKYISLDKNVKLNKRLLLLFLSGLFMGMSIATKWTGCFAAIGLAIIFFAKLIKNNMIENTKLTKEELIIKFKKKKWSRESTIIVCSCILFFVIIPILIYCACYIPHKGVDSFKDLWNLQISMYNYHVGLDAEHPYTSPWYSWFIMEKPVWYYLGSAEEGMHSTISGIGNPIIWWTGILAMIYVLLKGIIKLDKNCWFIIIAILVAILPYLGIERIMFMYHYFPVIPFMVLSIVMIIKDIETKTKFKYMSLIYGIIVFVIFVYYYPVVSGMEVSNEYIESTKWMDTWYY